MHKVCVLLFCFFKFIFGICGRTFCMCVTQLLFCLSFFGLHGFSINTDQLISLSVRKKHIAFDSGYCLEKTGFTRFKMGSLSKVSEFIGTTENLCHWKTNNKSICLIVKLISLVPHSPIGKKFDPEFAKTHLVLMLFHTWQMRGLLENFCYAKHL